MNRARFCGFVLALVGALLASACATGPQISMDPPSTAPKVVLPVGVSTVARVGPSPVATVGGHFLGVSLEARALCGLMGRGPLYLSRVQTLLRSLGPGILHLGGRTTDLALWRPQGIPECSAKNSVLTQPEAAFVFRLARSIGWKVLWEMPLERFNPASDAAEARTIASLGERLLMGWTIGNEPDLYAKSGFRVLPWGYVQYFRQWQRIRNELHAETPNLPVFGPDTCCNPLAFGSFAIDASHEVRALSLHYYAGSKPPHPVRYLLSGAPAQKLHDLTDDAWLDSAKVDHLPLDITEANTFPAGGDRGVSDRFIACLWEISFLFQALNEHVAQVDLQQSWKVDPYNVIGPGGTITPMYLGMRFAQQAAPPGSLILPVTTMTNSKVSVFAVRPPSGVQSSKGKVQRPPRLSMIIVNESASARRVVLRLPGEYRVGRTFSLSAPSPVSKVSQIRAVTAGRASVSVLKPATNRQSIVVSPFTAALIRLQR